MSLDSNKVNYNNNSNSNVAEFKRLGDNVYKVPAQGIVTRKYSRPDSQCSLHLNISIYFYLVKY